MPKLDSFLVKDGSSLKINTLLQINEKLLIKMIESLKKSIDNHNQNLIDTFSNNFDFFSECNKIRFTNENLESKYINLYDQWASDCKSSAIEYLEKNTFNSDSMKDFLLESNRGLIENFKQLNGVFISHIPAIDAAKIEKSSVSYEEKCESEGDCGVFDFGNIELESINNETRMALISKKHFKPEPEFIFPVTMQKNQGNKPRRINHTILKRFNNWLVYSHVSSGLYCYPCTIIYNGSISSKCVSQVSTHTLGPLIKEPMKNFTNLTGNQGKLARHENSSVHKKAVLGIKCLSDEIRNKGLVSFKKDNQPFESVNSKCMKAIINLMLTMTRQNIAIRGNKDSGPLAIEDFSTNEGNWREMLKHMCIINPEFKDFIENSSANATYISHHTFRKLQNISSNFILQAILKHINSANFFSIMFDETTDISGNNVLCIVVRYIRNNAIVEQFIGFFNIFKEAEEFFGAEQEKKYRIKFCLKSY